MGKKHRDKPRYLDPSYHESAPEYILRMQPENADAMRALLSAMRFGPGDIADLGDAIERINLRSIELLEKHARPEFIERARSELELLMLAKDMLCDG